MSTRPAPDPVVLLQESKPRGRFRLARLLLESFRLLARVDRRRLWVVSALRCVSGPMLIVQLLALRNVLELVLAEQTDFLDVIPGLSLLAGSMIVNSSTGVIAAQQQRILNESAARYAMVEVAEVASLHDLRAYEDPDFYDRLIRASVNAQVRPTQMVNGTLGIIQAIVGIAATGTALLLLEWRIAAAMCAAFIPGILIARHLSRAEYRFSVEQVRRDRRRAYLQQLLITREHAKEMRLLQIQSEMLSRLGAMWADRISDLKILMGQRLRWELAGAVIASLVVSMSIGAMVWSVTADVVPLADAGTAIAALVALSSRVRALQGGSNSLYEASLFIEDFTNFINDRPQPRVGGGTASPLTSLVLHDVDFRYPANDRMVLRGVSMEIHRGEVVAVVGENGSGKTTLALIVASLLPPSDGQVLWNGFEMAELSATSVRDRVAMLPQDFVKFFLDLEDNVVLGRWDDRANVERRDDAAERAGLGDVLAGVGDGWSTRLGPQYGGTADLSGGQWQRLALARVLFRAADLVILDEPTAALDPRAEADLYRRMRSLADGASVLLISHRLASVRHADRIIVMHDGEIVEVGRHEDLVASNGHYAALYDEQSHAYF